MFLQKINQKVQTIILYSLLITHISLNSISIENFNLEPYQSYIVACVSSCCLGIIMCILFQKYCCNKPTIVPKENVQNKKVEKEFFTALHSKIDILQKDINAMKEEQKNKISYEPLELLQLHKNCLLIICYSHWCQQYKETKEECEKYKLQFRNLLHKNNNTLQLTQKSTPTNNKQITLS